jgi:recombinational DNA repair protein (RecF pathway)
MTKPTAKHCVDCGVKLTNGNQSPYRPGARCRECFKEFQNEIRSRINTWAKAGNGDHG